MGGFKGLFSPYLARFLNNIALLWDCLTFPKQKMSPSLWMVLSTDRLVAVAAALLIVFLVVDPIVTQHIRTLPAYVRDIFAFITTFGYAHWPLLLPGIYLLSSGFVDARAQSKTFQQAHRTLCFWAASIVISVGLGGLFINIVKRLIGRGRPKHFEEHGAHVFEPFAFDSSFASFPSGHSTTAGTLIVLLIVFLPKWRWTALMFGVSIAVSRVVLGSHYPSDIIAGLGAGGVIGYATLYYLSARRLGFLLDRGRLFLLRPKTMAISPFSAGFCGEWLASLAPSQQGGLPTSDNGAKKPEKPKEE